MKLKTLLEHCSDVRWLNASNDVETTGLSVSSKSIEPGDCFVALKGDRHHGLDFVDDAIVKGACAVLVDEVYDRALPIPIVYVDKLRTYLGELAAKVYQHPSLGMTVVGVTGTNGKTTTALLLESLFSSSITKVGYIGTLGCWWTDGSYNIERTTPEAPEVHRILRRMADAGVTHVFMECSSHGLLLDRLGGVQFDAAVFTNISQDHLDFHASMEEYAAAKYALFGRCLAESKKSQRYAIFNVDDPYGHRWSKQVMPYQVATYSHNVSNQQTSVCAQDVQCTRDGIQMQLNAKGEIWTVRSPMMGQFNVENILAGFATAVCLGLQPQHICPALEHFSGVPGRLQRIENKKGMSVFVDYAHTDAALENVLSALKSINHHRLLVVFGCGGDRDRTKRPKMAKVVSQLTDVFIMTSDNPRSEVPMQILRDMQPGIDSAHQQQSVSELTQQSKNVYAIDADRKSAIQTMLSIAGPDDIVLVAGKGHETYQEIHGTRHPFDDRQIIRDYFTSINVEVP